MRNCLCLIAQAICCFACCGIEPRYSITEIPVPDGYDNINVRDLNDDGIAVGSVFNNHTTPYLHRGFIYQTGTVSVLPQISGYQSSDAWELNRSKQVVGRMFATNEQFAGSLTVVWESGTIVATAPSHNDGRLEAECGINDHGDFTASYTTNNSPRRAFAVVDGQFFECGTGTATSINNSNQVVGQMPPAFLWSQSGGSVNLVDPANGTNLYTAYKITDSGTVVGTYSTNASAQAYLLANGNVNHIGTLGGPRSAPLDLNDFGYVVGYANTTNQTFPGFYVSAAFVYNPAEGILNLNSLIPTNSGWTLTEASGINNRGEIVANGKLNGASRSALLSPLPPQIESITLSNCVVSIGVNHLLVGFAYRLQKRSLLGQGDWQDVTTNIASDVNATWSDSADCNAPEAYYRIAY